MMGSSLEGLVMAVSQRADGSMRNPAQRAKFLKRLGLTEEQLVLAGVVHDKAVALVGEAQAGRRLQGFDGLITQKAGLFVGILVGDCFPVFFYEKHTLTAAIAHAGWRGVVKGIVPRLVQKLWSLAVPKESLSLVIGPGLRVDHLEIKEDVLPYFKDYQFALDQRQGKLFVDLPRIIRHQAEMAGVRSANISDFQECTYCLTDKYFSYRRSHTDRRMLALIGWKSISLT